MSDSQFNDFFLRIEQVIGDRKTGKPGLLPMGRSRWYQGIKTGEFPSPVKCGRLSLWRATDIRDLISRIAG